MNHLLIRPTGATLLYVLAHGAGAGMRHTFMQAIAERLAEHDVATFRYEFPYMENKKGRPDSPKVATATVRNAVAAARDVAKGLPVVAGGKSFGGRMTSTAASMEPLEGVDGLAFLGFPLHAPGRPGNERAKHLYEVTVPMLFLQGTRDSLADLTLLKPVCDQIGKLATLHIVEGGDHSFKVRKKDGRTEDEVLEELAKALAEWGSSL